MQTIQNRIYEIRGRRVMLDFDLAELYQVETKRLKEQVKRNIERLTGDFMFELTPVEFENLRCQIGASSLRSQIATSNRGGIRYMPFAFTEQGVSMLSAVLRSTVAIQASISIMRAFVAMRQLAMTSIEVRQLAQENSEIRRLLDEFIEETEGKFDDVYLALSELALQKQLARTERRPIGFNQKDDM